MAEPDDDRDALTWEGDELVVDEEPGDDVDAAQAPAEAGEAAAARPEPLAPTRIASGVLLLAAIAAAICWILVLLRNPADMSSMTLLGLAMYQLGELLAVVAAPLWWFTAGRLAARLLAWRLVGLVVTAPWPMLVWAVA